MKWCDTDKAKQIEDIENEELTKTNKRKDIRKKGKKIVEKRIRNINKMMEKPA
jgi:hypothetical protein